MRILNLLDPGIVDYIVGPGIDGAHNAITLSCNNRRSFGNLKVYFEAVSNLKHRYIVKRTVSRHMQPDSTGTVDFSDEYPNVDPPQPRLLAIHRACCRIVSKSRVGGYLDRVACDTQNEGF
jgi:hypothetical protein